MTAPRCPHCHTELPEQASFCGACGRRIEGWSNLPSVTQGGSQLPGSQEATRQMEPTPSLLRLAKLQREKREEARKQKQQQAQAAAEPEPVESESRMLRALRRPRAPVWIAMVLVAAAGAVGGFMIVKRHRRVRVAVEESVPEPARIAAPAPPSGVAPVAPSGAAPSIAPSPPIAKAGKPKTAHAHRLTPLEVPIAQKKVKPAKGNGLPHKAVATDSRTANAVNTRASAPGSAPPNAPPSAPMEVRDPYPTVPAPQPPQQLAMPVAPHEEPAAAGAPPPAEGDDKTEASARIDADSVRLVVKQHLPQVHACYARAFKDGSPGGRVEIGFAINQSGRAENVRTEVNTTDSLELARCLEGRVREWQYPRPVGGDYELIYPFVFAPGS